MTETKYGKLKTYDSEAIADPIGEYWTLRRKTGDLLTALQENLQTREISCQQLEEINKTLSSLNKACNDYPELKGRKAWIEKEIYGHNGVLHSETTPILGASSPISPGLSIWFDGKEVLGKVTFGWMYEGGNHRVHGGWIAAVFDEFLATAMVFNGKTGVTAYIKTDYLKYTPVNEELRLKAYISKQERNKVFVTGEMWAGDIKTATAEALFIEKEAIPKRD